MNFQSLKLIIIDVTGLPRDALHIYIGVGVYLGCLLIFQRFRINRHFWALFITTLIAVLAEVIDIRDNLMSLGRLGLSGSVHDIINTCLLPYILFALSRWTTIFVQKD